ncbi:DUF3800 domain-containing protein [Pyrobaculum aerophilum]|uniref:DUF3800 domain-containing protein n=1 Tax=Pyrobaculum aerophilum TaxID=13773 RepID=A0A371R387_9CREN|nr:DUF3800 domain-containing protein [Pyrobaculum aerophilum]RFA95572.1 hypothetical protein CGL52_12760 [Pyrobaculum aerophilum]RFA98271.1 hypothetical protein CGL51_00895 [Pyrobaculum aerophilum]
MIVFVDESGVKSPCNCVALGAVAFEAKYGVTYMELGSNVVERIRRMARIGGELKWGDVRRRADASAVIRLISEVAEVRYAVFHFSSYADVERALGDLARGALLVVVDNQLLAGKPRLGVRVIERDSRRMPGLQLADVIAGFARQRGCP